MLPKYFHRKNVAHKTTPYYWKKISSSNWLAKVSEPKQRRPIFDDDIILPFKKFIRKLKFSSDERMNKSSKIVIKPSTIHTLIKAGLSRFCLQIPNPNLCMARI